MGIRDRRADGGRQTANYSARSSVFGVDSLRGHTWDVVIDNSGYVPRHVRDSAELLKDSVRHYSPSGYDEGLVTSIPVERDARKTVAPSRSNKSAMAALIPHDAPVTGAVR